VLVGLRVLRHLDPRVKPKDDGVVARPGHLFVSGGG
jgi:hypothetical protein